MDLDASCGASLARLAAVEFVQADLESDPWPFAACQFGAIVVIHYLHRPLLARIEAALAPDGLLLYETFAVGNERFGRPRNPDFLLRPGELLHAFSSLRVVAFEDGYEAEPHPAMVQRMAALRIEPNAAGPIEALAL